MDYLFTPWRYAYLASADKTPGCLFCEVLQAGDDRMVYIVERGQHCFIMLNTFPYTSGHMMIAPYDHVDQLARLAGPAAQEMMSLTQRMEGVLREVYRPEGINVGMNIGKAAGAGVAGHIHMHILPRWTADSNFMTTVGETRVVPEDLETTYSRLREKLG